MSSAVLRSLASAASTLVAATNAASCAVPRVSAPSTSSAFASNNTAARSPFKLADFEADLVNGFMLDDVCTRLPSEFDAWELALDAVNPTTTDAPLSLGEDESADAIAKRPFSESWRASLRAMPILSIDALRASTRQLQRAHHVLAYLAHFYIHSCIPSTSTPPTIPASISIPLCAVSSVLGITPILTYADTVTWNLVPRDSSRPLAIDNMRSLTTFTGTDDEDAFYQCCGAVELVGVEVLRILSSWETSGAFVVRGVKKASDEERIQAQTVEELESLTVTIEDLTTTIRECHGACSPKVFYDGIRPWFRGSSSGSVPWVYELPSAFDFPEEWNNLSGPSGGQSSLMHALDLMLSIDHARSPLDTDASRTTVSEREGADTTFIRRMQKYMPASQRGLLARLLAEDASGECVRSYVVRCSAGGKDGKALSRAYNAAVDGMRKFRDAHLKIACVYVVAQARKAEMEKAEASSCPASLPAQAAAGGCPVAAMLARLQAEGDADLLAVCPVSGRSLASASAPSTPAKKEAIKGTGGTELVALLRSCRDSTTRALIPASHSASAQRKSLRV